MTHSSTALVWLRRDLRLEDHAALATALHQCAHVQPVFVFDSDILQCFPHPQDRRLTFIARALCMLHETLKKRGGGLLIVHGDAAHVIPKLAQALEVTHLVAAEDYEPAAIARDTKVMQALQGAVDTRFVKDQLIFSPREILRSGEPYKVYTPYANAWRTQLTPTSTAPYATEDQGRYADFSQMHARALQAGCVVLNADEGVASLLSSIGYKEVPDDLWSVTDAKGRLATFIATKSAGYPLGRDMVAQEGTSRISPYLRFGLLSVRACVAAAQKAKADKWLAELIWREFYAMILYHFPDSITLEWNPRYRGILSWHQDANILERWKNGQTGYPLVDAAMRQLRAEGWMHNRARMVVASFLTKHLQTDWRLGEAHFAQYLMDYDLASNVGGWQWAASTGTDAQPYFRVFNPILQSEKFDPEGEYIRRYVPELKYARAPYIHAPWQHPLIVSYMPPIVDHASARLKAIAMFKGASDTA